MSVMTKPAPTPNHVLLNDHEFWVSTPERKAELIGGLSWHHQRRARSPEAAVRQRSIEYHVRHHSLGEVLARAPPSAWALSGECRTMSWV